MKLKEKKLDQGKLSLECKANVKEVDSAFQSAYLRFASSAGIKPMRDKTIHQQAKELLGIKDLDNVVQDNAMEALIPFAIDRCGLLPAYPPKLVSRGPLHRGQEAAFTLEFMPKPSYELSSYEPVKIVVPPFELDDKEIEQRIDNQIDRLAARTPRYTGSGEEREIRSGDAVLLEMESFEGERRIPGLSFSSQTYVCGEGFMPQGFDENIIGMRPGETKTFTFQGPDIDEQGNETTSEVRTTVTVLEIQTEEKTVITDNWVAANLPPFKTVDDLKADIRATMEKQARQQYDAQCRDQAIAKLSSRFQGSIPDEAYEAVRENLLHELSDHLREQGISREAFMEQQGGEQQFSITVMMQARTILVQGYALDALFAHEKMTLNDEDYLKAAQDLAPQSKPSQTVKEMEATGRKFLLRETAERRKAADWLLEQAEITLAE